MPYKSDRRFTDTVHGRAALDLIYADLGWAERTDITPAEREEIDINKGIDYVMTSDGNDRIYVQERFREMQYATYSDVTLRYRRDENNHRERRESEYYKIRAKYLVYGIIDKSKEHVLYDSRDIDFIKFAVVDIEKLRQHTRMRDIVISNDIPRSYARNGILYAAVKQNTDRSSSFVVFDVNALNDLFGDEGIILYQKGYF